MSASSTTVSKGNQASGTGLLSEAKEFPNQVSFGRRIYLYREAVKILNETKSGDKVRPLVACVVYWDGGRVGVDSDFWGGYRARVVLLDTQGNLSLSKEIKSAHEAERIAAKEKKQIADATLLANTKFMEEYRGELLVFSSRNASALSENDFREGWYVVGVKEEVSPKVVVADPEILLREVKDRIAASAKQEQDLVAALAALRAKIKADTELVPELEQLIKQSVDLEKEGTNLEDRKKVLAAKALALVRKQ